MRSQNEPKQSESSNSSNKELRVLAEVEITPDITQRQLSQKVGISLGIANALLRNLVRKGYLRSQQASWKRWVYTLTPEGVSHKIRLTVAYVRRFVNHYHTVRQILREQLEPLNLHEESRVAILGTGEFAELVFLGLKEFGISEIDVFATQPNERDSFLGIPVRRLDDLNFGEYDRVLVSSLDEIAADELLSRAGVIVNKNRLVSFFSDFNTGANS